MRPNRFNTQRNRLQDRYARAKANLKPPKQSGETAHYSGPDSIPVRPVSDLWKALGFTAVFTTGAFTYACIAHHERRVRGGGTWNTDWFTAKWVEIKRYYTDEGQLVEERRIRKSHDPHDIPFSPGQKLIFSIIASNLVVYLVWKVANPAIMWRFFTNSFASKSLCLPMLTSVFSHKFFLHFAVNMYVLSSFGAPTVDKYLGPSQFLAMYLSAGVFSSLTSLIHKGIFRMPSRALGASGAILAVLTYVCMKNPDARLQIIFLPFFDFSAQQGVIGIVLLDAIGLLLGWRLFDHAAHLGGSIFGILYALYGEKYYRQVLYPTVVKCSTHQLPGRKDGRRIYGGQVVGQALMAANRTIDQIFHPHSLHCQFIYPADKDRPLIYEVTRVSDGRSFCTRLVKAIQNGKTVFTTLISFQKIEPDSISHSEPMPEVPSPEECESSTEFFNRILNNPDTISKEGIRAVSEYKKVLDMPDLLFSVKMITPRKYIQVPLDRPMKFAIWVKSNALLGDDEHLHHCVAAFISDVAPIGTPLFAHAGAGFKLGMAASLDHTMWIHRPDFRIDEDWVLYETESTIAAGGRALIHGKMWTRDGRMVLSTAQEIVIRGEHEPIHNS
uniref:Peptidase S54 rhomboid domain-containing protein n=1 Tax=Acrobeloides nanus TaxID=290746 RepID=A0A914CUG9_9BILA